MRSTGPACAIPLFLASAACFLVLRTEAAEAPLPGAECPRARNSQWDQHRQDRADGQRQRSAWSERQRLEQQRRNRQL